MALRRAAHGTCGHAAASAVYDGGADDVPGRGGEGGHQPASCEEIQVGEAARLRGQERCADWYGLRPCYFLLDCFSFYNDSASSFELNLSL